MVKNIYDIIKRQNGERFARVLRDKCLLDIPDIAHIVKYAGHTATDAEQIFPYLWSLKKFPQSKTNTVTTDPFKLLDMAGYHAFEVHNLDEQNSIKRFFRTGEELCTFRDETRYKHNHIIHAVKHQVWRNPYAIRHADVPQRQDAYGTSVISIQIRKNGGFISITNRYNHSVLHPNQTFNSNPDEIIPGLTTALKKYFDVDWKSTANIPDGFILVNDQFLKKNIEVNNCYFGDGFYTQSGKVIDVDKRQQVQADYFIWDNQQKQMLNPSGIDDCFADIFNEFARDKQITVHGKSPNQSILADGVQVIELENNQIVSLNLPGVCTIGNNFLYNNQTLQRVSLPDATKIGDWFLSTNKCINQISVDNVAKIGVCFLYNNEKLETISLPTAVTIDHWFLYNNKNLSNLSMPRASTIGNDFLYNNEALQQISLPMTVTIGDNFLVMNKNLQDAFLPNTKTIGDWFLYSNKKLQNISLPNITKLSDDFLQMNNQVVLNMPRLECIVYKHQQRPAMPAINTPITDVIPERGNIKQRIMREMRKFWTWQHKKHGHSK